MLPTHAETLSIIGQAVSHYRVLEKLGGGGMGEERRLVSTEVVSGTRTTRSVQRIIAVARLTVLRVGRRDALDAAS